MVTNAELQKLVSQINSLVLSNQAEQKSAEFWYDSAAKSLIFIEELVTKSEGVNAWIPKNYNPPSDGSSILEMMFEVIENVPDVNRPLDSHIWSDYLMQSTVEAHKCSATSLYELVVSRCCALISQILGDRFHYVQKVLIKNLFSRSHVKSILASDIYAFILRLFNQQQKAAMCQVIMNLCKLAPPDALAKGASLLNRAKHPFINFESPRYQSLLDFSEQT